MTTMKHFYTFILASLAICVSAQQKAFNDEWHAKEFIPFTSFTASTAPTGIADINVTIDPSKVLHNVKSSIYGNNAVSWMNKNTLTDASKKRHFKNANISIMRWPGGNLSNEYFWDGTIPTSVKTDPKYDTPTSGTDGAWRLTNDGFLQLMDTLQSQAIVCVNVSYAFYGGGTDPVGTAAHYAAEYVRYMNKTKGYNIKYWEIGNENYGKWQAGYEVNGVITTGTKYGEVFRVFADSMKAADPSIFVGAVLFPTETGYNNWSALVLPEVKDHADFLILHEYFHPEANRNVISETDIYSAVSKVGIDKQNVEDMVVKYTGKPAGSYPIAMTEFNARTGVREISRTNALFIAMCLGEFITHNYDAAFIWDMQNGYDTEGGDHGIISNKDPLMPDFSANPSLYTYYFYNMYFGDKLIESVSSDTMVKVYASTFQNGELGMVLINKDSKMHTIELDVKNVALGNRCYWHTITGNSDVDRVVYINGKGPETATVGGPQSYESVLPNSITINGKIKLTLPAYSANFVAAEAAPAHCAIPAVNLGEDITLCKESSHPLNTGITDTKLHISWYKNNSLIKQGTPSLDAYLSGTYRVEVSKDTCPIVSDEIIISSTLIPVTFDTICTAQTATLTIDTVGSYAWHDQQIGGTLLSNALIYSPTIQQSTVYYVEDLNSEAVTLGLSEITGSVWQVSDYTADNKKIKVTVSKKLKLEAFSVFVQNNNTNIVLKLYDQTLTNIIYQWTFPAVASGKQRLVLNAVLEPGVYVLDPLGTDNKLAFQNTAATNPYVAPGLLQFENYVNQTYTKVYYGFYYDWEISIGTPCSRTPVWAVVDDGQCTVSVNKVQQKGFSVYPNPASNSLRLEGLKYKLENAELFITNTLGQKVYFQTLDLKLETLDLTINHLPSGLYFIRIGNEVQKFIKQ